MHLLQLLSKLRCKTIPIAFYDKLPILYFSNNYRPNFNHLKFAKSIIFYNVDRTWNDQLLHVDENLKSVRTYCKKCSSYIVYHSDKIGFLTNSYWHNIYSRAALKKCCALNRIITVSVYYVVNTLSTFRSWIRKRLEDL